MTTLSGISNVSVWSGANADRAAAMKERMFSRVDADGSGTVDPAEFTELLSKAPPGADKLSTDDAFTKFDANGDGSLDADELDTGMKSLMPKPSSTLDFAQQRAEGGGRPPGGPGGPGGPPSAGKADSSESYDPLDTNEDGTVSPAEQAAGQLTELLQKMVSSMDGNGDGAVGKDEVSSFARKLVQQALAGYGQTATASASSAVASA